MFTILTPGFDSTHFPPIFLATRISARVFVAPAPRAPIIR